MPIPRIRQNELILRLIKETNSIRANIRKAGTTLPLYDIANENTPDQLTASQDNYVPGNFDVLRLSSSKNVVITGIKNGVKGRRLQLFNVGSFSITLAYQSLSSDAENRFKFQSGTLVNLAPDANIWLYYDSTQQRWIQGDNSTGYAFGENFTVQTAQDGNWEGIAWSPDLELICVVGATGATSICQISSDAVTWTDVTLPAGIVTARSVAWSPALGIFAMIAQSVTDHFILTSVDGVNWISNTVPTPTSAWRDIIWAAELDLFVATANTGSDRVMISSDGSTWTEYTGSILDGWNYLCWSPDTGLLLAVGNSNAMTSPDGINWTTRAGQSGTRCIWAAELGLFLIISSTTLRYSQDGITWNTTTLPQAATAIAWSSNYNILMAVGTTYSMWSQDESSWNTYTLPFSVTYNDMIYILELGLFVAIVTGSGTYEIVTFP